MALGTAGSACCVRAAGSDAPAIQLPTASPACVLLCHLPCPVVQLRASDCTQAELRSQVEALQASQVQLLARLSDLTSRWQETVATNADLHKRNLLLEQRLAVAGGCRPSDSRDDTTAAASSQGQVMHA